MKEMTLRFSGGRSFIFWPKLDRVAMVTPLRGTVTVSLSDFQLAVNMALRDRRKQDRKLKRDGC